MAVKHFESGFKSDNNKASGNGIHEGNAQFFRPKHPINCQFNVRPLYLSGSPDKEYGL